MAWLFNFVTQYSSITTAVDESGDPSTTDPDEMSSREFMDRQQSSGSDSSENGRNIQILNRHYSTPSPSSSRLLSIGQTEEITARSVSWDVRGTAEPSTPQPTYVRDGAPTTGEIYQTQGATHAIKNTRFLPKNADTYRLETFMKNRMIIFNQISLPRFKPRHGTEKDVEALTACFSRRGFKVSSVDDCTRDMFYSIMELETNRDLSDYGCFAVVVLTHGSDYGELLMKDHPIYESEIIEYLKGSTTPSLITKPRLLIVQACRGQQVSSAVTAGDVTTQSISHDGIKEDEPYKMANETDLLLLHSTYPGMISHRGEVGGTWFIQSLCRFINDSNPDDDILSITRQVIHDVSINFEVQIRNRASGILETDKQVPVVTTTLSRKLCLNTMVVPKLNVASNNIDSQIKTKAVKIASYRSSSMITNSGVVHNVTGGKIVLQNDTYGHRHFLNVDTSLKYETKYFRVRYFNYVRGMLSKFIERYDDNADVLKSAIRLLRIARTIDCQMVLSQTGEEICLQIVSFLQNQDFDDKELLFLYTYS